MRHYLYRCDQKVYNKKKNKYLKCNNCIYRYLNDKKLCWCHYNKLTRDAVIFIQKIYRAYKSRRYIEIYKKLPDDLQIIIKRKISNDYYYKLHCDSIYKILKNRYENFNTAISQHTQLILLSTDIFLDIFKIHIYPTYYLYNKYFDIITTTYNDNMLIDVKLLHILSYNILNKIRTISQEYFYDNENTSIDKNLYNKLVNSIFIINTLSEKFERL